jgi:cytochrome c biogenesis protein CcmG, thiol:disulfide interchange protein DsbE
VTGLHRTVLIASWNVICAAVAATATAGVPVAVGQPAPTLVLQQIDGRQLELATLRGKVVLVNFWATWCAPCRAEMPLLDAFYRRHHREGLEVIGVSADDTRDREEVVTVMRDFGYPAGILGDATVNGFGSPAALPLTYLIDRAGIVRAVLTPLKTPITRETLTKLVLPLLQDRAARTH